VQFPAYLNTSNERNKPINITVMKQIKFPEKLKKSILRQKIDTLTPEQRKEYYKLSIADKLKLLDAIKLN